MAKLSVVIPLYNKEKDIADTLNSLFCQTFKNFEVVIVNDGSTDNSEAIVKNFNDKRIRLFSKENEGVSRTRNFGVENAQTDHIVFLDADDYWYPFHLENLHNLISEFPDEKWYATAYEKKHNKKLTTAMISPIMEKEFETGIVDNYFENSLIDALAWTSAVCMKKVFFQSLNGFDPTITNGAGEDIDLWLRAALRAPLVFSTKISARHNLDGSNRISLIPTKQRVFMNLDKYEAMAKENPYLKKYLDVNRFSFAIQHRLAKDEVSFENYVKNIDPENLTSKQRFLLRQSRSALIGMKNFKFLMESLGARLTAFNR